MTKSLDGESTPGKSPKSKNLLPAWQKGQSGNPAGRPKGSRQKLQNDFLNALADDFAEHGVVAISDMRAKDPAAYVKTIASLMPKQLELNETLEVIGDAELIDVITALRSAIALGAFGERGGQTYQGEPVSHLQALQ